MVGDVLLHDARAHQKSSMDSTCSIVVDAPNSLSLSRKVALPYSMYTACTLSQCSCNPKKREERSDREEGLQQQQGRSTDTAIRWLRTRDSDNMINTRMLRTIWSR